MTMTFPGTIAIFTYYSWNRNVYKLHCQLKLVLCVYIFFVKHETVMILDHFNFN